METIILIVKIAISLTLLMVWLVRPNMETSYRGGDAKNLKEEFAVYGLPRWFMITIGVLKVGFALLLVASIWVQELTLISSAAIALLMAGAVSMHIKVKDTFIKFLPSLTLLILSLFLLIFGA